MNGASPHPSHGGRRFGGSDSAKVGANRVEPLAPHEGWMSGGGGGGDGGLDGDDDGISVSMNLLDDTA